MKCLATIAIGIFACLTASSQALPHITVSGKDTAYPIHRKPVTPVTIAPNLYVQQFGFFCRKELQFEQATRLPLRFRLGSLNNCNYLEGKDKTVTITR